MKEDNDVRREASIHQWSFERSEVSRLGIDSLFGEFLALSPSGITSNETTVILSRDFPSPRRVFYLPYKIGKVGDDKPPQLTPIGDLDLLAPRISAQAIRKQLLSGSETKLTRDLELINQSLPSERERLRQTAYDAHELFYRKKSR